MAPEGGFFRRADTFPEKETTPSLQEGIESLIEQNSKDLLVSGYTEEEVNEARDLITQKSTESASSPRVEAVRSHLHKVIEMYSSTKEK